jgi:hypothetical protein
MTLRRETAVAAAAGFDSLRRFEDCVAYENNAGCRGSRAGIRRRRESAL